MPASDPAGVGDAVAEALRQENVALMAEFERKVERVLERGENDTPT